MSELTTSIIIRTKNEAEHIGKTLSLVMSQSLQADEVIVVDSGSTDSTVEIVKEWSKVQLIHMPSEAFTFGGSLNLGIKNTQSDIVISLTAHAYPSNNNWLHNLVKHFVDSSVAGVYGSQMAHLDAWPPVKREYMSYYREEVRRQTNPDNPADRVFSNANSAIRRSCWQENQFDETLTAVEDQEWAWEALKSGYCIVYEPKASVYHSHNETLARVINRNYRETLALNTLYNREVSIWRALKVWSNSVWADTVFILKHTKEYHWLLWVPIYRAATIYGCLKPSSFRGLWRLPQSLQAKLGINSSHDKNSYSKSL